MGRLHVYILTQLYYTFVYEVLFNMLRHKLKKQKLLLMKNLFVQCKLTNFLKYFKLIN